MGFKQCVDAKTATIKIRVTPGDKALLTVAARKRNLSLSAFLLRRMFGKRAPERYDYHAINELSALSRQLKLLSTERTRARTKPFFSA